MKYKLIEEESYNLHMINTKKFKTLFFRIVFTNNIDKDKITIQNLLLDTMLYSNNKYKTKKELAIKKQDLYGADIYGCNKRIGNYLITELNMSILNPKYTEEKMLNESLDFLNDVLFNPYVENNHFNNETFKLMKNNLSLDIKSAKENTSSYAMSRLKEEISDMPFSYKMEGNLEDLEKIDSSNLYKYYKEFINNSNIDIYVIGSFNEEEIKDVILQKLNFKNKQNILNKPLIMYKNTKKEIKEVKENSKYNQSKLCIGLSINKKTKKEQKYVTTLYNIILGNSPESKFFKNIREKKSLAYSINSSYRRMDNIMTISAGISLENYNEVIDSIKNEMDEMKKGNFTLEDIDKAKNLLISVINDIYEYPQSISEYYYNMKYLELDSIKKGLKIIDSITKEDIIKLANKVKIDTIYLLKEDENEKD